MTAAPRVGAAVVWLSVIVLLPLAAIAWQAAGGGPQAFWLAVTSHAALASFRVTLTIAAGVTLVNVVFGLLVAWVLVRDDFAGKRLVDAIIDLPFALPTIVASLVMLALYGNNSPVGLHLQHTAWGVAVALAFCSLAELTENTFFGEGSNISRGTLLSFIVRTITHKDQYGLPVYASLILVGMTLAWLAALLVYRDRAPLGITLALFALMPLHPILTHWSDNEQRNHWFGY